MKYTITEEIVKGITNVLYELNIGAKTLNAIVAELKKTPVVAAIQAIQ